jgi:hypothetical protein
MVKRNATVKARNQANSHSSGSWAGGLNTAHRQSATGTGAMNMKGWRRPSRERVRSDSEPMNGSTSPSKMMLTLIASPASVADSPSTWL